MAKQHKPNKNPNSKPSQKHQQQQQRSPHRTQSPSRTPSHSPSEPPSHSQSNQVISSQEEFDVMQCTQDMYIVEKIRKKKIVNGKALYFIKWKDWPESTNTWEPIENLQSCLDIVEEFNKFLEGKGPNSGANKSMEIEGSKMVGLQKQKKKNDDDDQKQGKDGVAVVEKKKRKRGRPRREDRVSESEQSQCQSESESGSRSRSVSSVKKSKKKPAQTKSRNVATDYLGNIKSKTASLSNHPNASNHSKSSHHNKKPLNVPQFRLSTTPPPISNPPAISTSAPSQPYQILQINYHIIDWEDNPNYINNPHNNLSFPPPTTKSKPKAKDIYYNVDRINNMTKKRQCIDLNIKDLTETEKGRELYTDYLERYMLEVEEYQKQYEKEQERLKTYVGNMGIEE